MLSKENFVSSMEEHARQIRVLHGDPMDANLFGEVVTGDEGAETGQKDVPRPSFLGPESRLLGQPAGGEFPHDALRRVQNVGDTLGQRPGHLEEEPALVQHAPGQDVGRPGASHEAVARPTGTRRVRIRQTAVRLPVMSCI